MPTAFALVAHTHSATNITSGTLSTSRYSAYSDLGAEGYLGDASGDVARNNGTRQVNLNADLLDGHDTADFAMAATVTSLQAQVSALQGQVDTLVALLANVSRPDSETIRFSDVNLQIVNGTGSTAGTGNGRGNLIVGYNENTVSASRTGSHNLVVGIDHEYTSYAGLLAGRRNRISGSSSSVMGYGNDVTANYGSISGGYENTVNSIYSSASGGRGNTVSAAYASISGGRNNVVSGDYASVSGGMSNTASGSSSSVSGGLGDDVSGPWDWRAGDDFFSED